MEDKYFCLRWNEFEQNMTDSLGAMWEGKEFFDVSLVCGSEQIEAHKVVLSACSSFFRSILRRNPHEHPLLYLKGVKYKELLSVLNFMYMGEVNVAQEEWLLAEMDWPQGHSTNVEEVECSPGHSTVQ